MKKIDRMSLLGKFKESLARKARVIESQNINYSAKVGTDLGLLAQGNFFVVPYRSIFGVRELNVFEDEVIKEVGLRPVKISRFRETGTEKERFLRLGFLEYRVSSSDDNLALLISLLGFDRLALTSGDNMVSLCVHMYPDEVCLKEAVVAPIVKPEYRITRRIPMQDIQSYQARAKAEGRC